jgi:aminoglycoside phosphotransferase (APT) family kinase protein
MPRLSRSAAQAVLARVEPGFRVTEVVAFGNGDVNTAYEVRGSRTLVIKVYPERWAAAADRWRSKLAKEVYVYGVLERHGVRRVPRVLHHEMAGVPELPWAFAVLTRLDGQPLAAAGLGGGDVEPVYREMGGLLAEVHRITAARWGYVATGIVDAKPSNTAYMLDQFGRRLATFRDLGGDPALAGAVERHVARHAELFAECRRPVLCHNDFHDGNVLVARDGGAWRVAGCLDVENAVVADPLLDLARTDYHALRDDEAKRRAFLDGYGPLPPGWERRVALYRLHHALEFWNWATAAGRRPAPAAIEADLLPYGN